MGYTHYYYRKQPSFDPATFELFSKDCEKVCRASEMPLGDGHGKGEPEFTATVVCFNGREDCGHTEKDLGIAWPKGASATAGENPAANTWFAGALIEQRQCSGNCSHETFGIDRDIGADAYKTEKGEYFDCCKTAFKPYDVCVTACLIVLAHHFGALVKISSDGESPEWEDGRRLCQHVLGYGADFELREEEQATA